MLRDTDLDAFVQLFDATTPETDDTDIGPLAALQVAEGGLFCTEVWRLSRSLQIAAIMGQVATEIAVSATYIADALKGVRCRPLEDGEAWKKAIASVRSSATACSPNTGTRDWYMRQQQVGEAGLRLRDRGFEVTVGAYGPDVSQDTQRAIAERLNHMISQIGGAHALLQICSIFREGKHIHDGMWMMGNIVPSYNQTGHAAAPWGWVMSLAIRNISNKQTASDPGDLWREMILLSIDLAAVFDCQRYGQFEDFNLAPSEIHRALKDSLLWREIFTLEQVPPKFLPILFKALLANMTEEDHTRFEFPLRDFLSEIDQALRHAQPDNIKLHTSGPVSAASPLLWQHARGKVGDVNASYLGPLHAEVRNQNDFIFYEADNDMVLILPSSFMASSACQVVFRAVWKYLGGKRGSEVVGKTFEAAIEALCLGKSPIVLAGQSYRADGKKLEMDVATRDGDRCVLFETKGKSLTATARAGDMMAYFNDYADSYLLLIKQLAVHDRHLREGNTPLASKAALSSNTRPIKVAVSPLSYGSLSDKSFATSLLSALSQVNLTAISQDKLHIDVVRKLNKHKANALHAISKIAELKYGKIDLHSYLIDAFWLDLGQVFYIIDRGITVFDAFRPMKNMTFSTRDFWTEVALADRQGFTRGAWKTLA